MFIIDNNSVSENIEKKVKINEDIDDNDGDE